MGIQALRDNIADTMPILYCHKRLARDLGAIKLFICMCAGEKEESNALKRPSIYSKGAIEYSVFGAPLFVVCCVKRVPEMYGSFQILE